MNVLSLFAGIGGLELGLERAGMTVVGQVEIDPYCQRVLAKHWPEVPRHDDVRTAVEWWQSEPRPRVDLVCGGFPCQDISNAGQRAGIDGERSGLWSSMARVVRALRPRYVLVENVTALLVRGFDVVLADLAASGYDADWDCVPAISVGAPHIRDRVFVVAHTSGARRREDAGSAPGHEGSDEGRATQEDHLIDGDGEGNRAGALAYAASIGRRQRGQGRPAGYGPHRQAERPQALADSHGKPPIWTSIPRPERDPWATEPDVGRVAHGVPNGVDRRRALGNAVVPQVAEHIGQLILAADTQYVELRGSSHGLPEQESLEERISRAEHDAGKPINSDHGRQSHCWLCRRDWEEKQQRRKGRA